MCAIINQQPDLPGVHTDACPMVFEHEFDRQPGCVGLMGGVRADRWVQHVHSEAENVDWG